MKANAMHIDPVSPALSSSSPLSDLLAADSVSDILALLMDDATVENPDARLQTFTAVVAHISTRCAGDCNSAATSLTSPLTPCSAESGSPLDSARWKWSDVLMRGVTDPWSRIRAVCLSPMADLLLSEVRESMTMQNLSGSELPLPSLAERGCPIRSTPCSRRPSRDRTERQRNGSEKATRRRRSLESRHEHAPSSAAAAHKADVSSPLHYVWRYWENTTHWYEHDGIVRLLVKVYGRSRTPPGAALRCDDAGLRTMLSTVLFPAFRDAQLPVRESAAALLGVLVDRERSPPISTAITSLIVDHVRTTLAQVPIPASSRSPLTAAAQESTRVLEGHLLALVVLVDMNVLQVADTSIMPLLLRLASYPASSVRQYIAEILRPPSPSVFVYLMERLCEHEGQKPHRSEKEDDDDDGGDSEKEDGEGELNWQRQETVMMALHQHFLSITAVRATAGDWIRASAQSHTVLDMMRCVAPLSVVFRAMHSPRFEIARMGLQLFPLLLQSCIRFLADEDLPRICEACCGEHGCVQRELNALQQHGDTKALAQAQLSVATVIMPALWFFLTIRRLETAVPGKSRTSSRGSRAKVEDMIRPYATLERVRFASQPHLREDSTPCVAATCALLTLTAYFACVMDPAEWHRCVDEVLQPSWWVELLSHPVRREQVRYGPDFVRAVHHCGTPEQSQRVVELVPTLTAALATAQTHQQCLLISMVRVAVSGRVGSTVPMDDRALAFAYHDVYAAPALTEGGEATPLGHTWLKLFVPTHDAVPTTLLWGAAEKELSNAAPIAIRRDSDVFRAMDAVLFKELFQSTKTEVSVLRELRSLMMGLTRLTAQECGDVDWYALALESVFGRLDHVAPRWREIARESAGGDEGAAAAAQDEEAEEEGVCWDDWDDDEEDADGCAQGIYEAEAIKASVAMVSTLREWALARAGDGGSASAADARFSDEFAALNIK